MKRPILCAAAVCLLAMTQAARASGQEETRCIIAAGHAGAVRDLAFDERTAQLFSSGDDGTVRIWDAEAGLVTRVLRVTQLYADALAVNPVAPQCAVVVTDGSGAFSLAVWDWAAERQLYRIGLSEAPLFLRYSEGGGYLMYGVSSWQGLKVIRAGDGSPVSFHPEGFGIVGLAVMSRSEKTLMTYQVSGSIAYWDFATGQQVRTLPTAPYLTAVRISRDQRSLAGRGDHEIMVVDAVTGVVRGRAGLAEAVSLDIGAAGDEVASLAPSAGPPVLWRLAGAALARTGAPQALPPDAVALRYGAADTLYLATADGSIFAARRGGGTTPFASETTSRLAAMDASGGRITLGSQDWVRMFSVDALAGGGAPVAIRSLLAANPFAADIGLAPVSDSRLLAWRADGRAPGFALMDTATGVFTALESGFPAPLAWLSVVPEGLLGVEIGGTVRIADIATGSSLFELRLPGAACAARVSPSEVVVGRNASASSEGSLLRVNRATGETVAIAGRNVFTYGLLMDARAPGGPRLYSVGVDAAGTTNLLLHQGAGFEKETLVDSVPEEDLDVGMALDPDSHVLYATLGRDRLVAFNGTQVRTLPIKRAAPRGLAAGGGLLYSLNQDSTVTVCDPATGGWLAELALFPQGEWCMLLPDGRYAASTGGDLHVRVFAGAEPVSAKEDYRVRAEIR
jgi:hypothetical protein